LSGLVAAKQLVVALEAADSRIGCPDDKFFEVLTSVLARGHIEKSHYLRPIYDAFRRHLDMST
jgi:hypothetical protein